MVQWCNVWQVITPPDGKLVSCRNPPVFRGCLLSQVLRHRRLTLFGVWCRASAVPCAVNLLRAEGRAWEPLRASPFWTSRCRVIAQLFACACRDRWRDGRTVAPLPSRLLDLSADEIGRTPQGIYRGASQGALVSQSAYLASAPVQPLRATCAAWVTSGPEFVKRTTDAANPTELQRNRLRRRYESIPA